MKLPPEFEYRVEVEMFLSAMAHKLHQNRHKGKWEDLSLGRAVALLEEEMKELKEAIARDSPVEILMECADVANFALIIASIRLRELGAALAPGRVAGSRADSPVDPEFDPVQAFGPDDFKSHGVWMEGNRRVSRMWSGPGGKMYYENVPEARDKKLPIYPFITVHTASPDEGTEGK